MNQLDNLARWIHETLERHAGKVLAFVAFYLTTLLTYAVVRK